MTNFNTIIDDIFPLADKTEYINALASYQLLIIDDLGVERNSEYALSLIPIQMCIRDSIRLLASVLQEHKTESNSMADALQDLSLIHIQLTAGITALIVANILAPKLLSKVEASVKAAEKEE